MRGAASDEGPTPLESSAATERAAVLDLRALVGSRASVEALMQALGYRYAADPPHRDRDSISDADGSRWLHAAGFAVVTPAGRIAQVFDGVRFDATQLRLALIEAAGGRIGTWGDRVRLVCAHLEAVGGRFGSWVLTGVRGVGLSCALLLGLWIWRHRHGPLRSEARGP